MVSPTLSSLVSASFPALETTSPSKLYAFLLKLRPIQEGTLMPFSGELVHAAWLEWLRSAAPDVATWLHEGNKRRLFTCSSLQFPLPQDKMLEVERRNVHWPLSPEKTYTIRVTLLLGELFPLFHKALTDFKQTGSTSGGKPPFMRLGKQSLLLGELFPLFHKALTDFKQTGSTSGGKPPFMRLGKQSLLLEEVVIENSDATGWTGFTSFADMMKAVQARKLGKGVPLKLEFASLTTFNRGNAKNREYDNYSALLPLPDYVFSYLAKRWNELAPPD